jgi:hypothetical protein
MKRNFALFVLGVLLSASSAVAGNIDSLYYICDGGDDLWKIHRVTGATTYIGSLGTGNVESMAYWPGTETIYVTDAGNFGTASKATAAYTLVANVDVAGAAQGVAGAQNLDDIDGLSFDPWTGILWASQRRAGDYDLLFQIDHTTGQYIQDAFGPNIDYLVIDGTGVFEDIDDIAISPVNGIMYTVSTQGGSAQLIEINKYTGNVVVSANADRGDIEGLAYHNDGTFWGSVGTDDDFLEIDPLTGITSNTVDINDANCTDPEATAALVADINLVTGTVWNDADFDQTINGGELGVAGITVQLFYDANSDGIVNSGDLLLQSAVTDANGDYTFEFATTADLLTDVVPSSLPAGFAFTTDNVEDATFTGFGQTEGSNNFGAATGPDADGDGIPDFFETTTADNDFDGVPDYLDLDSDNDGILDSVEGTYDNDGDGVANYLDLDADNDGIPDAIEANGGVPPTNYASTIGRIVDADADGDGLVDSADNAPAVPYGAGSTSALSNPDTDNDGFNDHLDRDADCDGILDLVEGGGTDADGNGEYDGFSDGNGDGYFDGSNINPLPVPDTDSDGLADYIDLDSDADGLIDRREGFPTAAYPNPLIQSDCDFDGILDLFDVDKGGWSATPEDTDGDGTPDYQDLDSDGDGISDAIEGNDADLNGVADSSPSGTDTDNDGIDDTFDTQVAVWGGDSNVPEQNQDADAEPDWRDADNTGNPGIFYFTCDATNQLYTLNHFDGTATLVGALGVSDIEAIAYWNGVLYGADDGDFGTINTTTGTYTLVGEIDGGGTASGSAGGQTLNDVDGLTFDPWTGILWASNRRGTYDLLFQIDPVTGQFIADAFGAGVDYIVIDGSGVYTDVDDIAISPTDGEMYSVGNNGTDDQELNINKYTGAVTVVGALSEQDVEGMAYFNDGTFWGSVGSDPGEFWEINPTNGNMTDEVTLPCGDPEALAALVAPINLVSGTVWDDADFDQLIGGTEVGIAGVTVNLYHDVNGDGQYDAGDILLQSEITDANGDYTFEFATTANLVMTVDLSTLPAGYALTTDNLEATVFADNVNFGETDTANNFGATGGADCDSDGIPDFAEGGAGVDTDNDGIDNMCDLDSDNDGILDSDEGLVDTDSDGINDLVDLDSDNDGIADALEANNGVAITEYDSNNGYLSGTDADGDGLIDVVDNDPATPYGGGSSSLFANPDHDVDGIPDALDRDSDNDGILDVTEAGGTDANGDGFIDAFNDGNGDGYSDGLTTNPLPVPNTDSNGNPDYIDVDADGDGLDDALEGMAMGTYATPTINSDADGDGIIDFWDIDFAGAPINPVDTDGDGTDDYQDTDSDNDSVSDLIEGNDADMNGVADFTASGTDADGDGIDDAFDNDCPVGGVYNVARNDYAEEDAGTGMDLGSSDLELTNDGGQQTVGIHYANVTVPQGTTITNAYIQFETDEVTTGAVTVTFHGEDVDNAATFGSNNGNITIDRTYTNASLDVNWSPNDWNTVGEAAADQQSPNIGGIIQAIVGRAGWVSGNDLVIIIDGSGSNTRTAENDPTLFITYAGGGLTWGCSTNTPHQDTDSDGTDDWRDIDDDGDAIPTFDETGDIDGSGIPDYLEIAPCPIGQTLVTTAGNADAVVGSNLVTNPNNSLGAPNTTEVTYQGNNNSRVDLDLTDVLPAGTTLAITWRKISGGGNAEFDLYWGSSATGPWTFFQNIATNSTSLITTNVTIPNAAQFFRIERDRRIPALDAVAYSFIACTPDFDMDGIPDGVDLDSDNDGISDVVEGIGDTDGDGQADNVDLDSDNDGIPDAIEANAGVLPANMNDEGQYSAGFVANPANDLNINGWIETGAEGGETYANNVVVQLDTDLDGIVDRYDLDSDNDCVPDGMEANDGVMPANMDNNGQYPVGYAIATDTDADGIVDDVDSDNGGTALANSDTDSNGVPNYIDNDSDNDGIFDNLEAFDPDIAMTGLDADNDGLDNACDPDAGGTLANMPDEDCNTLVDYLDAGSLSAQTGNYTTGATWNGGSVPVSGKSISVASGHVVTLTGNTTVATVFVQTGGVLDINGFDLHVLGRFTVDGNFVHSNGKVLFEGTCNQVICGNIAFYDIEINNSSNVNVNCGDVRVQGVLEMTDGDLDVCNANTFTLISGAISTANVINTGTGDITCDVIRRRYKAGCGSDGYMMLASPYATNDLNDWNDDVVTTGFPLSNFPNFLDVLGNPFVSIYNYDETVAGPVDNGWTAPNDINDGIVRGKGYYVYEGMANYPLTIDVTGDPDFNSFNFPLSYTNSGFSLDDGYNMLGNPFPSAIDWELTAGWNNVGCCDAIWAWDECTEQYASYIGGVAANGGTNVVESSQAFWVKAHVPGASLSCNKACLTSAAGDFRDATIIDEALTIHMNGFSSDDETVLWMKTGTSHGHDDDGDALKLKSKETRMGIYTLGIDSMENSINGFPHDHMGRVIPVMVRVPQSGSYTLDFSGVVSFPNDVCILLEDKDNGTIIDLKTTNYYTFNINTDANFQNRFDVIFEYPVQAQVVDVTCYGANNGQAVFVPNGVGPYDVIWQDANGNIVQQQSNITAADTLDNLTAGTYILNVIDNGTGNCANASDTVTIQSPAAAINVGEMVTNVSCAGDPGNINITVYGGTAPYTYLWSTGATTQDVSNLQAGVYDVQVTDQNGCVLTASYNVTDPGVNITSTFAAVDTVDLNTSGIVSFTNTSSGANYYVWNFGDGSEVVTDASPVHTYDSLGVYQVMMIAYNGACSDTTYSQIVVLQSNGVEELNNDENLSLYVEDGSIYVQLNWEEVDYDVIQVFNSTGKLVHSVQVDNGQRNRVIIDLSSEASGAYIVRAIHAEGALSGKVTVMH